MSRLRTPERLQRERPQPPGLVMSDLGRDDPPSVAETRGPRGWEARQRERQSEATAVFNILQQQLVSLGGILNELRAPASGDVGAQISLTIPAVGYISRQFPAGYQAIAVGNPSAGSITVTSQAPQSQAPTVGTGVLSISAGLWRLIPMKGVVVTVYGAPGSAFDIVVYTRPRDAATGVVVSSSTSSGGVEPAGVLVAAGQTATQTVTLPSIAFERIVIVLNVSAVTGGTVTLAINGVSSSGYVYPLLNGLAVTGTGVTPYRIGNALTPSANAVANDVVPDKIQVVATVTGTITYGIDYLAGV